MSYLAGMAGLDSGAVLPHESAADFERDALAESGTHFHQRNRELWERDSYAGRARPTRRVRSMIMLQLNPRIPAVSANEPADVRNGINGLAQRLVKFFAVSNKLIG